MNHLVLGKVSTFGLGVLFLTLSSIPANCATPTPATESSPVRFTVSLGTEILGGDTTYQIGDPVTLPNGVSVDAYGHFPFSELKWPLDIWLAKLEGSVLIKDVWRINATLKKNISDPGGNMEDSDWLTRGNPGRLDVYSESEISSFDALIFDVDFEWIFVKRDTVSFYAGLGLLYQNFDYDGKLINQYSPSGQSGWNLKGNGEVGITYEMTYTIPYVKIGTDFQVTPALALSGSFSFSPVANAEDIDNHLLRDNGGKISTGDMDGTAFMFDFSGKYMFTSAIFMKAGLQYLKIDVDGTTSQAYGNGTALATVTEEAESSQVSGFISLGYAF